MGYGQWRYAVFYGESGLILYSYSGTLACMKVGFIATHRGNNTRGVFLFEDDKDSKALVTEIQISVNLKSVLVGLAIYFG